MNDGKKLETVRPDKRAAKFDQDLSGEEYVRWAYRLLLGREPESPEVIRRNPFKNDRRKLVDSILTSAEFASRHKVFAVNPYASWREAAVAFIHLPKTGGTTLHNLLVSYFDRERTCPERAPVFHNYTPSELARFNLYSGHFDYFSTLMIPRQIVRRVSIFRDPVNRLLSWYRFKKAHPVGGDLDTDMANSLAKEVSSEEFFEDPRTLSSPNVNNGYLTHFGASVTDRELLKLLVDDFKQPTGETTADVGRSSILMEAVERATERIQGLDAIGLTERFSESVETIFAALGLAIPQNIVSAMVTDELPNFGLRFSPVGPVTMTKRLSQALHRLTKYDQILYSVAKSEFARRRAQQIPEAEVAS